MKFNLNSLQALGRALMLPIALLPVAGLLLRFGQPDLLNIKAVAEAGNAVFTNLPLLFAIGVAIGFAKDSHGAAGLAAATGYLIMTTMLKVINSDIDTGVLGGIIIGSIAGVLYNKYKDIKLPEFLAFFGSKRFVPIITGISGVIVAGILGYIWPPIQSSLQTFSLFLSDLGGIGLFMYGFLNRLFLITGLHHVFNSLFWFQLGSYTAMNGQVVHGDIARFMNGDPSAGYFMSGFFPIMMFGLPATCLAMYTSAFKHNKQAVAGLLLSMALTSFLTGITEPIEYAFVFLAPVLYLLHAILTGISMAVMYLLHTRLGFSFSAGAIDYVLFYKLATNPLYAIAVGGIMFIIYYSLGIFFIRYFNLATIGRQIEELPDKKTNNTAKPQAADNAMAFIAALGGSANLLDVEACTTRLRLKVVNRKDVNQAQLRHLGAKGIVNFGVDAIQVVLGPQAELIASQIKDSLVHSNKNQETMKQQLADNMVSTACNSEVMATKDYHEQILAALGGANNVKSLALQALTRIRIELGNEKLVNIAQLNQLGVPAVININATIKYLYLANNAKSIADGLQSLIK